MRSPIAYLFFFFLLLLFVSIYSINGFEIYGGNDSDDFDVSKFSLGMSNHGIHSLSNRINNQNNNNNINNNNINQNNNYYNNNHNNNNNGVGFVGDSVTLSTSDKMTPDQEAVIAMLEEQNREWMALAGTGGACDMAGICKNGGTCNNIDGVRHTCLCPPQWTGDSCEIPAISSSSAIIAPTGLTSHLSSSLMTAITGSLTTSLSSGLTNSLSSGLTTAGLTSSSSSGLTTAGLTTSSSSGITAPPPNTPPPPTTPPPFPLANPSIVEGATGLQAGIIYVSRSRNGNSGFYILGAIATSMSVGFIVYVVAKRDADIDASESFAHLRPKKYRTPIKKKTPAENEEKKFADEEQGGGKRPSPDDVVVDTQPPESKQDVPDAYTVMDFQSVFALKNNVLDQKTTTRPVGETAAAPIDPQLDVHFVLHE